MSGEDEQDSNQSSNNHRSLRGLGHMRGNWGSVRTRGRGVRFLLHISVGGDVLRIMSRRPARFTESDLARVIRVADRLGVARTIEIRPDGTISLVPVDAKPKPEDAGPVAAVRDFVL